jgi:hypothetical protein
MNPAWLNDPEAFQTEYTEWCALVDSTIEPEEPTLEADDLQEWRNPAENDCPLDGDFDSAMASAGLGTDEDYNHYDYGDEF